MNASFSASKKIAKQIKLVSYRAELQIYELSVTWQEDYDSTPSILFLPEHFLYPYAVEKKKFNQSMQISIEDKRKTQKQGSLATQKDKSVRQIEKSFTLPISRGIQKTKAKSKQQLNFDSLAELNSTKEYFSGYKKQILKIKLKNGRKKRKC